MFSLCLFQSIFISRVTEDGPAGQAGIQKGDKLLSVSIWSARLHHTAAHLNVCLLGILHL